jgi:hypothetical protein
MPPPPLLLPSRPPLRSYVDNMNKQIAGTDLESKSLDDIIKASWNGGSPTPVFNNAAQVGCRPPPAATSRPLQPREQHAHKPAAQPASLPGSSHAQMVPQLPASP